MNYMKQALLAILIFLTTVTTIQAQTGSLSHDLFLNKDLLLAQGTPQVKMDKDVSVNSMVPKNKGKAFLMSMILPGLGERYTGNTKKAQYFFASEVTLWLAYSGLVTFREWRKDEYKTYAASYAGVDLSNKDESYFVDLGNYDNINEYNAAKLRDRNLPEYYYDVEGMYWDWENATYQHNYEQLRISADRADNRATFVIGAILANHVVSAIDAVWSVYKHNKNIDQSVMDMNFQIDSVNNDPRFSLNLSTSF